MAASVRRIVRGKRISDNLAGRSSVFQNGREAGDAPSYLRQKWQEIGDVAMAVTVRRIGGQIVMALLILFRGGRRKTSKKIKCSRIKINIIK